MTIRKRKDLVGISFNRWTVLEEVDSKRTVGRKREYVQRFFKCKCECGTIKEIGYSNITRGASKSCGCLQKEIAGQLCGEMAKKKIGELNPNWKGGISNRNKVLKNKERLTKEYRNWRKLVITRDECCIRCSSLHLLEAHHLINFKSTALDYDLSNGVCLCHNCHHRFHKKYGFRKNSKKQLEEYISLYTKQ